MEKCLIVILSVVGLMAGLDIPAGADPMASANYRITTTVMSGGGRPMGSTNFQMNATMGQPSPLIDPNDPPWSSSYDLLTGFWFTLGIESPLSTCPADFEPDGDVDDDDLATLAGDFGQTSVIKDADGDLDMDGLDLYWMVVDFNHTDCMD